MKITNNLDFNSLRGINLLDPTGAQDAATKAYVDALVQGLKWKDPVRAATTANITLSGAQSIDGVSIIAGDRVLVKNQSTASTNGIYVAAAGAWTRATDYDASAEILGSACFVSEGTTLGNSVWLMTTDGPITLATTSLVYTQIGSGTSYTGGTGISIAGSVISIDTTVTGRKAAAAIGDGTSTTLTFTHSLNTQDITVSVRETSTNIGVLCDWTANGVNTVQLTFATAPAAGAYRVVVTG